MFAARRVRLHSFHHRCSHLPSRTGYEVSRRSHRTLFTSAVETLSEGFLDLALALPFPPSLPPYSTTIILFTVVSRLAFTLPFSIWAQQRRYRVEEIVQPTLEAMAPKVTEQIMQNMREEGLLKVSEKDYKDKKARAALNLKFKGILAKRTRKLLATRRRQLLRQHNCNPLGTFLIPITTQLPLFFGGSVVLSHLSRSATPFDSESFLMLTSLSHVDPTTTLPIVLGFLTLANVESSSWFMTDAQRHKKAIADAKFDKSVEAGEIRFEWGRIVKSGLRLASVGRVLIASMIPGGVVLYWVSSATFGLLQTWAFDYWSWRRQQHRSAPSEPLSQSTQSQPLARK